MNYEKIVNSIKKNYPFFFIFGMIFCVLLPLKDMCSASADAEEIWKAIKTYGQEDMYGTYVLYKGMLSVYPYLWLYRLSIIFRVDEWFFIKIFYATAFSYITTIGLPQIVEGFLKTEVKNYRKVVLGIVCFYFWIDTGALSQMMVDIPSFMYFLFLINSAIALYKNEKNTIIKYLWCGFWLGINLCSSGQYTMPAICIGIFVVLSEIKKNSYNLKCILKSSKETFVRTAFFILPIIGTKFGNAYFIDSIVEKLRLQGAWIPSASDWLAVGLTRFMHSYRYGGVRLSTNRNAAIFADYLGTETFGEMYEMILGGGWSISILEYLKIFLKHPVDFILCYLDKFFIMLSPDKGGFNFIPLFIFYTLLFITLYIMVTKCKKIRDYFSMNFWIVFAFLWSVVPIMIMTVEMRCVLQLQGLVLAIAIGSDFIWGKAKEIFVDFRKTGIKNSILELDVKASFIVYIIFIIFCFMHIASLYNNSITSDYKSLTNMLIGL